MTMEDLELKKLIAEAFDIIKSSINYGEVWLEGGCERELVAVSAQVMSRDSATLLINKVRHCNRDAVSDHADSSVAVTISIVYHMLILYFDWEL